MFFFFNFLPRKGNLVKKKGLGELVVVAVVMVVVFSVSLNAQFKSEQ